MRNCLYWRCEILSFSISLLLLLSDKFFFVSPPRCVCVCFSLKRFFVNTLRTHRIRIAKRLCTFFFYFSVPYFFFVCSEIYFVLLHRHTHMFFFFVRTNKAEAKFFFFSHTQTLTHWFRNTHIYTNDMKQ